MKNKIEIYIVGGPGSSKSHIREHLLAWFAPAIESGKMELRIHTVQQAPKFDVVNKDDVS